jgi:hypothetical protein
VVTLYYKSDWQAVREQALERAGDVRKSPQKREQGSGICDPPESRQHFDVWQYQTADGVALDSL